MALKISDLTAVVLAGGRGTRIQHLLDGLPKPMAPVAGRPFLEWVVRYLAAQGLRRVIISTGYRAEVVNDFFAGRPVPEVSVQCVAEPEPLGTAGGFLQAAAGETAPPAWLVLNGDSLIFANLAEAVEVLNQPKVAGVIIGREVEDAARFGTLETGVGGELLRFAEKRPGRGVINAGVYLLPHELLASFPAGRPLSFEQDVFSKLTGSGGLLKVHAVNAPFLDIGTPESLPRADLFIRENHHRFSGL
jgi:NDP-sugar pyrophosphorylase family protein